MSRDDLHGQDLIDEMRWKYAGGPVPAYRRRRAARAALAGCALRFAVALLFAVLVIELVRLLLLG